MRRLKIFVLCIMTLVIITLVAACNTQNQTPTQQTPTTNVTQTANNNPTYVGEQTCQSCHKKDNFDKTHHVQSFKPLSDYKLDKTYGTVTVYDGAANNAKSTTVDLSKALGVQMDTYVVAQIPQTAGFAKQYYRVGHLIKNSDGTYKIDNPGLVTGTQNWSAGDYTCLDCHSPGMGKSGTPDLTITCEACHGPGSAHVAATTDDQRKATMVMPTSETCLKCHQSDPTKDSTTGAIITTNHYGTRDYTFSKHNTTGMINGCLTCHSPHDPNASGQLLKKDNPNDICATCHAGKNYDVNTIMWKNKSDPHGHTTADHSFTAVPESATKVNTTTKNVEITDPTVLDMIKKALPDLAK
ncbi:cytochrome c3 family protein [Desulfosporosinus sp. PR]|uniref:cytochrome c3 family protein n=1 Tax=Candidatus Desulfosporosinus nitrosoreducens TaxID=3401928 RepID=UPI0027E9C3F7|nr:cytochrome c3 family protein [Desulfosporosinus sp. PR]MDQ7092016.1 cytochrome c3 family protein [Desulfosporosinus sp. PR]